MLTKRYLRKQDAARAVATQIEPEHFKQAHRAMPQSGKSFISGHPHRVHRLAIWKNGDILFVDSTGALYLLVQMRSGDALVTRVVPKHIKHLAVAALIYKTVWRANLSKAVLA